MNGEQVSAEEKAAAREALKAAQAPGNHSTKGWKPYVSEFCKPGRPDWSARQCRGEFGPNGARCNGEGHNWPTEEAT